jgi:hypothetical protein
MSSPDPRRLLDGAIAALRAQLAALPFDGQSATPLDVGRLRAALDAYCEALQPTDVSLNQARGGAMGVVDALLEHRVPDEVRWRTFEQVDAHIDACMRRSQRAGLPSP